jgi:hypothetical protein
MSAPADKSHKIAAFPLDFASTWSVTVAVNGGNDGP